MKKHDTFQLLNLLAMPVITAALGLILVLSPDTASALVGKILGWVCVLGALACAFGGSGRRNTAWAIGFGIAGVWMLANPLMLSRILGRVLGLFLLLRGIRELRLHLPAGKGAPLTPGLIMAAVIALVGLVLVCMPLATSRMIFRIIGVVMICIGAAEGIDRLKFRKQLDEGSDPNIIDVEKL